MLAGEELSWYAASLLDPEDVCRRTGTLFDCTTQTFKLKFFSQYIDVYLNSKIISGQERGGDLLLGRLRDFSTLAILSYLIHASDAPCSGELINPADLSGGHIYTGGTHVLPVHLIADKYRTDREGFIKSGVDLGGQELNLAEASLLLHPFPGIGIAILLWLQDDEFSARSVLLVDSSSGQQLPPDALWLTTTMCIMALI